MQSAPDDYEVEIQNDNKIAANWLLWIYERKREYATVKEQLLESSDFSLKIAVPSNRSGVSDPTGSKGIKAAHIDEMVKWFKLIAEVEEKLPWRKRIFLQLRREYRFAAGRKGWTAAVQYQYAHRVAEILNVRPEEVWIDSRRTFYEWWNEIIDYTVRLACKRGLLAEKVEDKAS